MTKTYLNSKSNFVFLSLCITFLCGREIKANKIWLLFFTPAQKKKILAALIVSLITVSTSRLQIQFSFTDF